ncbi:MAG: hypothetical protein I3J02_03655 [Prevotella sp.]|nr:hypothetical protein [Prevotella sp.]
MPRSLSYGVMLGELLAIWFFLRRRWTTIHWGSILQTDWWLLLMVGLLSVAWMVPESRCLCRV